MTDGVDRRKTKDVLWMALQCAIDWKHSLIDAYGTDDSAIEELDKDVKAIKRLREKLFPNTRSKLDGMIQEAESMSIFDLRELMEGKELVDRPCGHSGCLSHVTHPCEGCGRIAGRTLSVETGDDHELD